MAITLKDHVALRLELSAWGNRKKINKSQVQTDADKRRVSASKQLINSPEYKAIITKLNELRSWVKTMSVPSFEVDGLYLFDLSLVKTVNDKVALTTIEVNSLVDELIVAYPQRKAEAQKSKIEGGLGSLYNEADYPDTSILRQLFGIETSWKAFDIPKTLPADIYKEEQAKAAKKTEEVAEQIQDALRIAFKQLVDHAVDRLSDKKKIFRDSLLGNLTEFIETFKVRNLTDDKALETLLEKAKAVVNGTDAESLRENMRERNWAAREFEKVQKELDGMLVDRPSRKFKLDEED